MDELRRLLIFLFGVATAIILSILVMIHGWGLEPVSYWWIIGVGVFLQIFLKVLTEIMKL